MVVAPNTNAALTAIVVVLGAVLCSPGCGATNPDVHDATAAPALTPGPNELVNAALGPRDDKLNQGSETASQAELARYAVADTARDPVERAAALALLQLREQVFLPFRTASPALIDGAAIEGWRGREGLARSFRALGVGGLHGLAECVRSASDLSPGSNGVHLVGDDPLVLGVACLDMLADAFGYASLPTLLALASRHGSSDASVALERGALERVRRVAPTAGVTRYGDGGRWREEVDAWLDWLARQATARPGFFVLAAPTCDSSACLTEVMRQWLVHATTLVPYRGWTREPRYLTTLRAYLISAAPEWLPWLDSEAHRLLAVPAAWAPRETGLVYDLWASTAAIADPAYFRGRVAPALVGAISTPEAATAGAASANAGRGAHFPLQSELAVHALEGATGLGIGVPDCAVGRAATASQASCIEQQTAYWRAFVAAGQPLSARGSPE